MKYFHVSAKNSNFKNNSYIIYHVINKCKWYVFPFKMPTRSNKTSEMFSKETLVLIYIPQYGQSQSE